jgi:hypothetical protein
MASYAVIYNNKVINIIAADDRASAEVVTPAHHDLVECPNGLVAPGWTYENGDFTDPAIEAARLALEEAEAAAAETQDN